MRLPRHANTSSLSDSTRSPAFGASGLLIAASGLPLPLNQPIKTCATFPQVLSLATIQDRPDEYQAPLGANVGGRWCFVPTGIQTRVHSSPIFARTTSRLRTYHYSRNRRWPDRFSIVADRGRSDFSIYAFALSARIVGLTRVGAENSARLVRQYSANSRRSSTRL